MLINFTPKIESGGSPVFIAHPDNEFALGIEYALSTKSAATACVVGGNGVVQNTGPMEVMLAAELHVINQVRRLPIIAGRDEKRFDTDGAIFVASCGWVSRRWERHCAGKC